MQIIETLIGDLIPAEYNPRQLTKDQHRNLTESIKRFGLVDPIIANSHKGRENIVIGGHQRLKIALQEGYKTVPVVYLDLTEEKEKELNIRLNRNVGEWDWDKMANFDLDFLKDIGFDDKELAKGLNLQLDVTEDEAPEPRPDPNVKLGDLFQLGNHRLLCGDATKKEDMERLMDGQKADMVFTDPPYGLGGYAGRSGDFDPIKGDDEDVRRFYDVIPEAPEQYVWGNASVLRLLPTMPRDVIVWKKNSFGMGRGYRGQYELCFYYGSFSGSDSDVWEQDKDSNYKHPTQKPVALAARAIKNSSPQSVLDVYGGSGSTLIACEQLNRKCYMMEIDPQYVRVIIDRWEKLTGNKAVKL